MANAKFEEAMQNRNGALKNEEKMSENIRYYTNIKNKKAEEYNGLKNTLQNVTHVRVVLESALEQCREIKDTYFPNMANGMTLMSTEYTKTFNADFVDVNLQNIYNEDLDQTRKEIVAVFEELETRLNETKKQEVEATDGLVRLRNDVTYYTGIIEEYVKKRNLYRTQVEEFTIQMRRYQ